MADDRRIEYTVSVEAATAKATAQQLRQIFEAELKTISLGGAELTNALKTALQPATALRESMQAISQSRPGAGLDDFNARIAQSTARAAALRNELERLSTVRTGPSAAESANKRTYVEEVRKAAGDEAAHAASMTRGYLNVGQRGAEFKADDASLYTSRARDELTSDESQYQAAALSTLEERGAYYELLAQLNAAELETVQLQRQQTADQLSAAGARLEQELSPQDLQATMQQYDAAEAASAELAADEARLVASIAATNAALDDTLKKQAAKVKSAGSREGEFAGLSGDTSRVQFTVSEKSAANLERMVATTHELTAATQELAVAEGLVAKERVAVASVRENADTERRRLDAAVKAAQIEADAATAANKAHTERIVAEERTKTAVQQTAQAEQRTAQQLLASERNRTAATLAEANLRLSAQRAEDQTGVAMARARQAQIVEGERRLTEQMKQENRERTAATRAAAREQTSAQAISGRGILNALVPGGMGGIGQSLMWGAAGALGFYGIDSLITGTLAAGKTGAQAQRQEEMFGAFAARAGADANQIIAAVRKATDGTVNDFEIMGLATQVLASKFGQGRQDISQDLATMAGAARQFSRIFPDESGRVMSSAEVFSRLVKFVREGNKELVDQFAIDNKRIAAAMGVSVDGMAGASKTTERFTGLLKVLNEELARMGPVSETNADRIEASAARIEAAKKRLDAALAGPTAQGYEDAAHIAELALYAAPQRDREAQIGRTAALAQMRGAGQDELNNLELLRVATLALLDGQIAGMIGMEDYAAAIDAMIFSTREGADLTAAQIDLLRELITVTHGGKSAAQEAAEADAAAKQRQATAAKLAGDKTDQLLRSLAALRAFGGVDIPINLLISSATVPGMVLPNVFGADAYTSNGKFMPGLGANPISPGSPASFAAAQEKQQARQAIIDIQTENAATARELAKREADAAQREMESAAKKAGSAFEQAAKDTASHFKSKLDAIPGLTSPSAVTEEDLKDAELGIYQEKPDEYLRQLRDEVGRATDQIAGNEKDIPQVDLGEAVAAARAAGVSIPEGLRPEAQLRLVERAWADLSFFARPANLGFLRGDVVQKELFLQGQQEQGKQNIYKQYGLGNQSPLAGAEKQQFAEMVGLDSEAAYSAGAQARTSFDAGFYAPPEQSQGAANDKGGAFAASLIAGIDGAVGASSSDFGAIGGAMVDAIHTGFQDALGAYEWSQPLLTAIAGPVAEIVFKLLEDRL